jgi:uncharacterized protein (TIGR02598 family)
MRSYRSRHLPRQTASPRNSRGAAAFSILEIAIAIGVVAFGFVALFGLLPTGLDIFRRALESSVSAQIVQHVAADAQQTDFATLQAQPQVLRYFDEEGTELLPAQSGQSIYTAQVTVTPTTKLPGSVSQNLITLAIKVAKDPGHSGDFSATTKLQVGTYVAFVARNKGITAN